MFSATVTGNGAAVWPWFDSVVLAAGWLVNDAGATVAGADSSVGSDGAGCCAITAGSGADVGAAVSGEGATDGWMLAANDLAAGATGGAIGLVVCCAEGAGGLC